MNYSREGYSSKSDLWSIGIIMYQFLTGKFPFEGASPFQMGIAFNHAVLIFPSDLVVTKECLNLIRGLLQVEPAKRIDWDDFFSNIFVCAEPKIYEKLEEEKLHSAMLDSAMVAGPTMDTEDEKIETEKEIVLINEIKRIRLKIKAILQTFYDKDRVLAIDTYTKEIFDVLWKLSKRLKPIIEFFTPKYKALILQSDRCNKNDKYFIQLISCDKVCLIPLPESLIYRVRRNKSFISQVDDMIAEYETIANNLVGYAEIVMQMKNYASQWSLFKYALGLGHEGDIFEREQKELGLAAMKYFQAYLVIELILSEAYAAIGTDIKKTDTSYRDCYIVDEKGHIAGQQYIGENIKVEQTLKIKELEANKIQYLIQLKNELKARCFKLNKLGSDYMEVFG